MRTASIDRSPRSTSRGVALALALCAACTSGERAAATDDADAPARPSDVRAAPDAPARWEIGRVATAGEVAAWDRDVNASGVGLPRGEGTHADGARTYAQKCASCHGANGEGIGSGSGAVPRIIGREPRDGFPFGRSLEHRKTVGNYWPYATTVYDYVRRAMPLDAPGSLTPDELYGLTAFLLAENEIIARDAVMDARTLPAVRMPARGRFVPDDRAGGQTFR